MRARDKPQNGIAGLRHWRYDLGAGLQVALVSLPLSLGIAVASGAPPVTGVISAIIAGLIFPFLGGAYVTISGPAAGLAPALLAGMLMLGDGDLTAGYPLLLVAICITGFVQIILSLMNAGRFSIFLPATVVEAMLAAIGIMIIVKQIPPLLGDLAPLSKDMLTAILKLPESLTRIEAPVMITGIICLFLMFYLNTTRINWLRRVPAALAVAIVGIILGYVFNLEPRFLINMPDNILQGGITLPDFDSVWNRTELWGSVLIIVITLTLIDGIESLATIAAVDKIDPFQRKSHANTTLRAMGVSNMLSSIAGGLTIIPGGVKSRANIDAGGRTLWANFYNAVFLIVFLFLAKDLISRIPLAAIGAILVYVGWRLCEYRVFKKTYAIGRDQIVIFLVTIVAILATDLLFGIMIGIAAEISILVYLLSPSFRTVLTGRLNFSQAFALLLRNLLDLFRSPIIKLKEEEHGGLPHFQITLGSVVCFNLLSLDKLLQTMPERCAVTLVASESGHIIDHTGMEYLHDFQEECLREGRAFRLVGMENYYQFTPHSLSARMHDAKLVQQKATLSARSRMMEEIAAHRELGFSPSVSGVLNRHDFIYLRRGDMRQESNVMTGEHNSCHIKLFDYSHTAAPDYYTELRHTLIILRPQAENMQLPDLVITSGHYLERYLVGLEEMDNPELLAQLQHYSVYRSPGGPDPEAILKRLLPFLQVNSGLFIEIHDNAVLIFHPGQDLETEDGVQKLFTLGAEFCAGA
ncbi:MAG: SulP family inorganic anion transporter [Gammaproteobacteria bacterium]|nr:SulP family inorganic anion transporter [Gammaproteobacteria bacterium]MDH3985537.1 SulP family inorganic anion transporter [Gammaproteobacteria bacterium]